MAGCDDAVHPPAQTVCGASNRRTIPPVYLTELINRYAGE
jgi:hypothetical protein